MSAAQRNMAHGACLVLLCLTGIGFAAAVQTPASGQPATAANPAAAELAKLPPGYLARTDLPDSLALLPPPPAAGSAAMQGDEAARDAALMFRGTPRFAQAAIDAQIAFPQIPQDFSCAAGFDITRQATPKLYGLMVRMLTDVGLSTYAAKDRYKRVRPFVMHDAATCYPKDEALLRSDGSYPSGHSALGWGWALVLSEIDPDRADAILQRGSDFGQSRLICDAHWQSDIDAGRMIAAATVARLHGDAAFRSDVEAARSEAAGARRSGLLSRPECTREAAALAAGK